MVSYQRVVRGANQEYESLDSVSRRRGRMQHT